MYIKFIKIFFILIILLNINQINILAHDYFPLHVENAWYYGRFPGRISGIDTFNGKQYYRYISNGYTTHYRKDESGNVFFKYENQDEFIKYKINAEVGDIWSYEEYEEYDGVIYTQTYYVELKSKTDTIIMGADTIKNCYQYYFDAYPSVDEEHTIWLAPDIGKIKTYSNAWGITTLLTKAKIDGERIPKEGENLSIVETIPFEYQSDIPVDVIVKIVYNFEIDLNQIDSTTFKVFSKKHGHVSGQYNDAISSPGRILYFTPNNPFDFNDTISVFVSSEIVDYIGDKVTTDKNFYFITKDNVEETIPFNLFILSEDSSIGIDFDWGDYDDDDDLDLVIYGRSVSSFKGNSVVIFENTSDGFKEVTANFMKPNSNILTLPGSIKWVDYNNDNKLDIVYQGITADSTNAILFYKDINGLFELDQNLELPFKKASMDWLDYNNDNIADLAIWGKSSVEYSTSAAIYNNNGNSLTNLNIDGLLESSSVGGIGQIKWFDFNSDDKNDFIFFQNRLNEIVFYENQDNSFVKSNYAIEPYRYFDKKSGVDFADINNDNLTDMLIGGYLLLNDGNKFILDTLQIEKLSESNSKFHDFDGDNDVDLFIIGFKDNIIKERSTFIHIYENINNSFHLFKEIDLGEYIYFWVGKWNDINNDGLLDFSGVTSTGFYIYYNDIQPSVDIKEITKIEQSKYFLYQNFPNPFNPNTIIKYYINKSGHVKLKIYDIQGQEIETLVDDFQRKGEHEISWRIEGLASGIYFYSLQAGNFSETKKLIIQK